MMICRWYCYKIKRKRGVKATRRGNGAKENPKET
jgi:hypothetical protein